MKVTISHEFRTDPETFWKRCFLDEAFNRALYVDALKFPAYEVIESSQDGALHRRKVRVMPKQEAPAPVQKALGGAFSYIEDGVLDTSKNVYRFKVIPGTLAERIRADGELRIEQTGERSIRRVVDITIEVKVFGIGGLAEGFVSKSMQETYAKAAEFTTKYLTDHGL
jgi:hypothetical protein